MKGVVSATCALLALLCVLAGASGKEPLPVQNASAGAEGAHLAVLMYHQLTTSTSRVTEHTMPRDAFEKDIQLLLQHGFTPISLDMLISYSQGAGDLPEKPILITFDDGNLCFYRHAYPILLEYGVPAVLSPVASWVERESDSDRPTQYITAGQAREMVESGLIEIGNHSYDMHEVSTPRRGVLRMWNEDDEQYASALAQDVGRAQAFWRETVGREPVVFAYPYGFCSSSSENILEGLGFAATFGCWERINVITGPQSLKQLGRFNRSGFTSSEKFMDKIEKLYP